MLFTLFDWDIRNDFVLNVGWRKKKLLFQRERSEENEVFFIFTLNTLKSSIVLDMILLSAFFISSCLFSLSLSSSFEKFSDDELFFSLLLSLLVKWMLNGCAIFLHRFPLTQTRFSLFNIVFVFDSNSLIFDHIVDRFQLLPLIHSSING